MSTAAGEPVRGGLVSRGIIPPSRPQRLLAFGTFVNMIGSGVYMTSAALFFTRSVGLSVAQVGLGMGIAALVGMFGGIPAGHLADRIGPREVYLVTLLAQAVAMAALVLVHSFWLFAVVVCLTRLAESAAAASRGPLVRGFGGDSLTRFRSYLRSVANLATSFGALAAGVAVQVDTRTAYLALVLGNAASFVACGVIILALPSLPPVPAPSASGRWLAMRDPGFLAVTALDGILSIQGQVLMFALPLWIVGHTSAPRWFVGAATVINTAMVVVLQVRASRGVDSSTAAARTMRRSGVAFFAGMTVIAAAGPLPPWAAAVALAVGVAVHTVGELWHAAGSMELGFRLAPAHAQGQYSGVYGLGMGLRNVVAPSILGLLCVTWGAPGWVLMGAIFVVAGLTAPAVVRWAERTRPVGVPAIS